LRRKRYALLAAATLLALAGLAFSARAQLRALARARAEGLRDQLARELAACAEHARYLARRPPEAVATYLTYFRGLARARILDRTGRPTHHFERFPYQRDADLVAELPPRETAGAGPGFFVDASREEVDATRRLAVQLREPRDDGGALELTVLVDPFLEPLRAAGAMLRGAGGQVVLPGSGGARAEGDGWSVEVATARAPPGLHVALGGAILVLAFAAVVLSERQIRARERALVAQRLERQERLSAIGLLASGIAHEINNPLEGIANWLALGDTAKVREGLDRIGSITKGLLSFARPDGGGATADAKACAARALDLARHAQALRGVEVAERVPDGLLVAAPPRVLEQVLVNLLLNAGAATGGAGRVEIAGSRDGPRVRIAVSDSGKGIAPEDLPHLFDPFFSRSGGTGLGLSVSREMARACGGDLVARNGGPGAVFTLELPAP
jgi:signal transduction histidine kinase